MSIAITSCQKDDFEEKEIQELVVQENSPNAFYNRGANVSRSTLSFLKKKTNNTLKVSFGEDKVLLSKGGDLNRETTLGTIETDTEVVVINETNIKHTFNVQTLNQDPNSVTNIIVVETGTETFEYFLKYIFTDGIVVDPVLNAIDFSQFNGVIETYDASGSLTGALTVNNGSVVSQEGQVNPCPVDEDEEDSSDSSSPTDGTSGSGSTSGISTGSDGTTTIDTTGGGGGWFADAEGGCGLSWEYGECGCPTGPNDGHGLTGNSCCNGSPLVIKDCNGNVIGTSKYASSTSKEEVIDPCAGTVGVILDLCTSNSAIEILTSVLSLSTNQADCLGGNSNCNKTKELDQYMIDNPSEIEFGQLAADAICAEFEVDYDKKIIYEITDPCQLKIIKEAFNNTSALTQTVKNVFTGVNTNYSYKIKDTIIPNNQYGGTRAAATDALPTCATGNCTFTTQLNTWVLSGGDPDRPLWNGATDLSIAKTVIHESLHALLSHLLDVGAITTTDPDPDLAKLAEAYAHHQAINNNSSGIPLAQLQHEYMVSLVNEVATALQQVGQNLGYINNFDYYRKLAWSGSLEHANAFPVEFTPVDEEEAKAIGKAELYNKLIPYSGVDAFGNAIGLSALPKGEPANSSNSNCN